METLKFQTIINAPVQKVWHTMLDDASYRQWAGITSPGSHFVGNWDQGTPIKFLGINDDSTTSGLISKVLENRQYEYILLETQSIVMNDKEIPGGDWAGGHESYTFKDLGDGTTQLDISVDTTEDEKDRINDIWVKGLEKIKSLAES